jgi:mannose-6-phosphate isomerase class I
MGQILTLRNEIQHYAWGDRTAIPELLNLPSSAELPCAELWMGPPQNFPAPNYGWALILQRRPG